MAIALGIFGFLIVFFSCSISFFAPEPPDLWGLGFFLGIAVMIMGAISANRNKPK